MSRSLRIIAALVVLLGTRPLRAIAQADSALARRVDEIVAALNTPTIAVDTIFAPAFLAQASAAQIQALFTQLNTQLGRVDRVTRDASRPGTATQATYQVAFAKGYTDLMTIEVDPKPPHLITGLIFGSPTRVAATLDDVMRDFRALPGQVSVLAARLDAGAVVPIAGVDTSRALAIGSAFKLYVLAELIREVGAGTRHWSDVVRLDSMVRSLPSGVTQSWPAGTPVTIETLAVLMISQSDNTAADELAHLLGRDAVERIQRPAGNTHASRNLPFLTTREMFGLKTRADSVLLRQYRSGSIAERRSILARLDREPLANFSPDFGDGPVAIDSVEWFASASDLARTMLWIRDHTTTGAAAAARGVLAVNPGIQWSRTSWAYVGYKGGSEPGVLDMTFLLRRNDGDWFVLTATWNDPAHAVAEGTMIPLLERAGELLAGEPH